MDLLQPVYTETAQCQDCYKCLRQCSVKAIKIQDGHAMVMSQYCVQCGHCVRICPARAKKVRNDIQKAKLLLGSGRKVIISLAPSWITEFTGTSASALIAAIKKLGFDGVSETALGAQEVSANVATLLAEADKGLFISSACPTVVQLIKKYYPQYADNVTDMLSPVLAHCRMLKAQYGDDTAIVFVGPCVAKKTESDLNRELLEASLTFQELRAWLEDVNILPEMFADSQQNFIPERAEEGSIYPVDGGMIAGIRANCSISDANFMAFSGIENIKKILCDIDKISSDKPLFVEMLACEGGCVNGPLVSEAGKTALKRFEVLENSQYSQADIPRKPAIDITHKWDFEKVPTTTESDAEIRKALESVGKIHASDELNCGSCGYDTCREFASALLNGKAEQSMCVSYMRKLAHKKADSLIKSMPSGVVIVDRDMRIVESNRRFAEILGPDALNAYEACPGLENAVLEKIVPFHEIFANVLDNGIESVEKDVHCGSLFLHVTVFTIESHRLAGGVIQDITQPAVHKQQIINKAKDVIAKNLATVQKIAYLLGENASESEVILNSIVRSFGTEDVDRVGNDE